METSIMLEILNPITDEQMTKLMLRNQLKSGCIDKKQPNFSCNDSHQHMVHVHACKLTHITELFTST
jgi:hypothetical protein